jgi:PKHD-type hydroxylase
MRYDRIYNNPFERNTLTFPWVYWDGAFTDEEMDNLEEYFGSFDLERGTTIGSVDPESGEVKQGANENVRKSNLIFINRNEQSAWIYDRLNWVLQELNNQFYGYDLNGYDTFQYTEYDESEQGRYDFHQDMVHGPNMPKNMTETRKLSMTMMINRPGIDFEGGDFQVNTGMEKDAQSVELKRGRIIAFPSYLVHRVAPVTKGKRKSLVVWVLGPKFK